LSAIFPIILIDDGSTDGTSEWIQQNIPDIHLLKGDGNLWWSGGVNMGIRYAKDNLKSDYILLWNNDVRPEKNYFIELNRILTLNPVNSIVLSEVYIESSSGTIISSKGGNFNPVTGKLTLIGFGLPLESYVNSNQTINWFPGMGTAIHKSVFDDIGYFDDVNFPQYKGDADFGLRAFYAGYNLVLYPSLKIWNDRDNTGYGNEGSWKEFFKSLTTTKSNNNIYRDLLFYSKYGKSIRCYGEVIKKYFMHIGGFFKWKLLGIFGMKREQKY